MINVEAVAQYLAATSNGNSQDNALIQQLMNIASSAQAAGAGGDDPSSVAAAAAALRSGGQAAQGVVEAATIAAQPTMALAMGYGMTPEQEMEALAEGIKMFVQRYPIDPRCYEYLTTSSSTVIARVLRDFRAPREGDQDYSRIVTTYIKRVRAEAMQSGESAIGHAYMLGASGYCDPSSPLASMAAADIAAGPEARYDAEVAEFLSRYPCDERARDLLQKAAPAVQRRVLTEFRPKQLGDSDYSALLTTFTQKCIHQQMAAHNQALGGGVIQQMLPRQPLFSVGDPVLEAPAPPDLLTAMVTPGLDTFLAKYPVDERAYDFFATSSQQVQNKVLREFRPKAEGEASYSGLFTSFVRKVRALFGDPGTAPPSGGVTGAGVATSSLAMVPVRQRIGAPSQPGVVTRADAGFRPLVTPNMAWAFEEIDPTVPAPDVDGFRARYPMDDRAWDFLQNVDVRVQKRVVETFMPHRPDDADFSAGITAYIKSLKRMLQEVQAETELTQEAVDIFFQKYPCDQRATEYFNMCSREVQAAVLRDFKPRSEGDGDYSAAITAYIKRCRAWAEPRQEAIALQQQQQLQQQQLQLQTLPHEAIVLHQQVQQQQLQLQPMQQVPQVHVQPVQQLQQLQQVPQVQVVQTFEQVQPQQQFIVQPQQAQVPPQPHQWISLPQQQPQQQPQPQPQQQLVPQQWISLPQQQQFAPQSVPQPQIQVQPQQGVQVPPGHVPQVILPRQQQQALQQQQTLGATLPELENPAKRMRCGN